jgi:photosystem II stability/assembly factor-like uncharacterized protein
MRIAIALASVVVSIAAVSASPAITEPWARSANLRSATVFAIAVDPVRPTTMYAATYKSGVIRSTDGGRHWRRGASGLGRRGVRSLAIDPTSPSTVYAGTYRAGVYKTTNGGASWSALKLPYVMGIQALVVDPREPKTVYAGTESAGVFKTTDGGVTWTEMNAGMSRRLEVLSLAIDPRSPKTIYAGTFRQGYEYRSLFKTTDGAASWRELKRKYLGSWGSWKAVAVDPRSSATVYALFDQQFFKSTNGGMSWSSSKLPGRNPTALAVDPRTSHLYVGMGSEWPYTGPSSAVYRSVDGGRTWQPFGSGLEVPHPSKPGTRPPPVHHLAFSPQGDVLFAGTDSGGVFQHRFKRG